MNFNLLAAGDGGGAAFILIVLVIVAYFIPSIIAASRGHVNTTPIVAVNILLGWTFLGWVAAFVWSLMAFQKPNAPA